MYDAEIISLNEYEDSKRSLVQSERLCRDALYDYMTRMKPNQPKLEAVRLPCRVLTVEEAGPVGLYVVHFAIESEIESQPNNKEKALFRNGITIPEIYFSSPFVSEGYFKNHSDEIDNELNEIIAGVKVEVPREVLA